jgi:hypothetical protein
VRSASPHAAPAARLAVLAVGASLLAGAATGCETTQEKAAAHQAKAAQILEAREKRQAQKKKDKSDEKGGEQR